MTYQGSQQTSSSLVAAHVSQPTVVSCATCQRPGHVWEDCVGQVCCHCQKRHDRARCSETIARHCYPEEDQPALSVKEARQRMHMQEVVTDLEKEISMLKERRTHLAHRIQDWRASPMARAPSYAAAGAAGAAAAPVDPRIVALQQQLRTLQLETRTKDNQLQDFREKKKGDNKRRRKGKASKHKAGQDGQNLAPGHQQAADPDAAGVQDTPQGGDDKD